MIIKNNSQGMQVLAKYYFVHRARWHFIQENSRLQTCCVRECVCVCDLMIILCMLNPSAESHHHSVPMRCDASNEVNYLQEELSPAPYQLASNKNYIVMHVWEGCGDEGSEGTYSTCEINIKSITHTQPGITHRNCFHCFRYFWFF